MPLTPAEETDVAQGFLQAFGEDNATIARVAATLERFSAGSVDLITAIKTEADTWQPFIDSGLSIGFWKDELQRFYDIYVAAG